MLISPLNIVFNPDICMCVCARVCASFFSYRSFDFHKPSRSPLYRWFAVFFQVQMQQFQALQQQQQLQQHLQHQVELVLQALAIISTEFFSRLIKVWRQRTRIPRIIRRRAITMVVISSTTTTMVMMTMMTTTTWIRTVTTEISDHVWFVPCRSTRQRSSSRDTSQKVLCYLIFVLLILTSLSLSIDCCLVFLFDNVDVHDQTARFLPFIFVYLFVLSLYDISIKRKQKKPTKNFFSRARTHTT